jgi:hypothetical protein
MTIPVHQNSSPRVRIVLAPDEQVLDLTGGGVIELLLDDVVVRSYPGGGISIVGPPTDGTIDIDLLTAHTTTTRRFRLAVTKGTVTSTPAFGLLAVVR